MSKENHVNCVNVVNGANEERKREEKGRKREEKGRKRKS